MYIGEQTTLECQTNYSGNSQPRLTWYRDEHKIASNDEFDIRLAKQTVQVLHVILTNANRSV